MNGPGGSQQLLGQSTFSGSLKLTSGNLEIVSPAAFGAGSLSGTGNLILNGGDLDNISGSNITLNAINVTIQAGLQYGNSSLPGSASLNLGTGPEILAGAAGSATFNIVNNTLTLGGVITGTNNNLATSSIIKTGSGTLALAVDNSNATTGFTGLWQINQGNLAFSADNQLGVAPATPGAGGNIVIAGGQLNPTTSLTLNPNRIIQVGNTTTGPGNGTVNVNSGLTFTIGGNITDAGSNGDLVKGGLGTLILTNGANNYTGSTVLNAGNLIVNVSSGATDGALGANTTGVKFTGSSTLTAGNTLDIGAKHLVTVN